MAEALELGAWAGEGGAGGREEVGGRLPGWLLDVDVEHLTRARGSPRGGGGVVEGVEAGVGEVGEGAEGAVERAELAHDLQAL